MSKIAESLETTPQNIHQTRRNAEAKLSNALIKAAETSDLQIKKMRPNKGLLWGYHPGLKREAVISYTTNRGIKVWYWYNDPEMVADEDFLLETKNYLLDLAEERKVELTEEEKNLHPAKLANKIFDQLILELKS
jgi:hypothetical protein